jgi:hypothetical protein
MAYEVYREGKRHTIQEPVITVTQKNTFLINAFAMEKHFKGASRVLILLDRAANKFAIKPLQDEGVVGSYKLSFTSKIRSSTGVVAAKGFVKHIAENLLYCHKTGKEAYLKPSLR